MIRRPRFPIRQQLRFELSGACMPLKCFFNRLEHERDLGLLHRMARAVKLLLPVHQGQHTRLEPTGSTSASSPVASSLDVPSATQKSTKAEMPASCLRTLSKVSCFIGSPLVSSNVSIAWSSAR